MKTSGLGVHKDSIFCAIYDGKSYSIVQEFSTTTNYICISTVGKGKKCSHGKHLNLLDIHMGHFMGNGI